MKKCPLGDKSLWKLFFGWISEQNYSSAKTMAPHCKPTSCYPRHSKSSVPNDHINQVADIRWLQIRYEYLNLSFQIQQHLKHLPLWSCIFAAHGPWLFSLTLMHLPVSITRPQRCGLQTNRTDDKSYGLLISLGQTVRRQIVRTDQPWTNRTEDKSYGLHILVLLLNWGCY